MIIEGEDVIVLDGAQRNDISEILLSVARWCLYEMNYRGTSSRSNQWTRQVALDALSTISGVHLACNVSRASESIH
jgi:hypothetical protein